MKQNGHNTFLPKPYEEWILNDTYPRNTRKGKRMQVPYLYRESTNKKIELGHFHSPGSYRGEWRCDTHPRASNSGTLVCIDSPHGRNGRQMYLIDISGIVAGDK